ncbi:MAG TPA: orotidine-5'-phosphate decarboxylase [Candidatus Limnocylindrales bacterium]|nr:orotidine-5'-phosphate decarboxylase [Candidatus Limnocylindrales bacterium]
MSGSVLERLRTRREAVGAPLCIGVDPHPDALPDGLPRDVNGIETFARELIQATAAEAAAIKINVAFFEAFGAEGWAALERVRRDVPPDVVCILDAKRGDIGSTAERYAAGLFGTLQADAVTLSPYLGEDAIEPFLSVPDRLVYVLARTSNPSAGRLQGLVADGQPLHLHVARWAADRWSDGRVGLVVGATMPEELRRIREAAPGPGFLVPGVGAQGGDLEAAVRYADGEWAPGIVSVSRAIAGASRPTDWQAAAASAARELRGRMADAVLHSLASPAHSVNNGGS